jgi:uncharacterized membrane protein
VTVFRGWFRDLTYGFLLVPGLVALVFIVLAFVLVEVDRVLGLELPFSGDASGARGALSSIAGSLITVAGLSFSITIVTLQLVSSQFSPRAISGFLADRLNQAIAGVFVGTFSYCLLVLGTVRERNEEHAAFVPALSVAVAVVLGISSLGVLLVFIHHMSRSIQVARITGSIAQTALEAVQRVYPERFGDADPTGPDDLLTRLRAEDEPAEIRAERPGYVQLVAVDDMVRAVRHKVRRGRRTDGSELVIHIRTVPGAFVTPETTLAELWPSDAAETVGASLRRAIRVVEERDIRQDIGYGVRQLVDIALRAISPGVNDPTTAVTCLGYIRAILEQLAGRGFPDAVRRFPEDAMVVIAAAATFEDLADEAFVEIARYGRTDARVTGAVLEAMEATAVAAAAAGAHGRARWLVELAETIAAPALEEARTQIDRDRIQACLDRLREVIGEPPDAVPSARLRAPDPFLRDHQPAEHARARHQRPDQEHRGQPEELPDHA